MWKNRFSEELRLAGAVVTPDLQHDVRGARVAVFLDAFDAFLRSAGNRSGLAQDVVCNRLRSGFAAAFLHGIGDWLEFFEGQSRRLQ